MFAGGNMNFTATTLEGMAYLETVIKGCLPLPRKWRSRRIRLGDVSEGVTCPQFYAKYVHYLRGV